MTPSPGIRSSCRLTSDAAGMTPSPVAESGSWATALPRGSVGAWGAALRFGWGVGARVPVLPVLPVLVLVLVRPADHPPTLT